ncbi:uncharacterized protein LOC126971829 [Leptidea sinapis]|uniref:uncharacterized protein LOC126971829 n=1 Tax=Leptidea sinapis TaxID=189913 RepID=UPI002141B784|nr:uncharacterized protein LOC126971829 [Leptidea sinapis]
MTDPNPSGSVPKKRVFIHRQAREMAKNVLDMCIEERQNKHLIFNLNNAFDRASRYTGLSKRTLAAIQNEAKKGPLCTPSKKKRPCNKKNNLNVDDFDRNVIRRIIEEFYLTKKIFPTCIELLAAIREKIEFPWRATSLRKLLKEMGYKWHKRRILVERPAVACARSNYLRKIRQYRQDNRNIFFLDETWIDKNLTFKKCWRNEMIDTVLTDTSSTYRLILVHAGTRGGFINGAKLLFKAGTTLGDYQGQMNSIHFEKWATEILIPNLPQNSVIVMDNTPYYIVQENRVPTLSSTKTIMLEWLTKNNVETSLTMSKDQLFRLVQLHKPTEKSFKIDEFIRSHGHVVVTLPPYMCNLNPIELAWAKVKRIVKNHNVTSNLSLSRLKEVTELALTQVTEEDWCAFNDHIIILEENYWQRDGLLEDTIDLFVTKVSDCEDSDTKSNMSESDDN